MVSCAVRNSTSPERSRRLVLAFGCVFVVDDRVCGMDVSVVDIRTDSSWYSWEICSSVGSSSSWLHDTLAP